MLKNSNLKTLYQSMPVNCFKENTSYTILSQDLEKHFILILPYITCHFPSFLYLTVYQLKVKVGF